MSKNRKNNRGKIVAQWQGYKIRKMVEKKPNPKKIQWPKLILDKGTYGIYAGKNLKKEGFKTVEKAINYCRENYNKN